MKAQQPNQHTKTTQAFTTPLTQEQFLPKPEKSLWRKCWEIFCMAVAGRLGWEVGGFIWNRIITPIFGLLATSALGYVAHWFMT